MIDDSIRLGWRGKEYTCPINMRLIKDLESNGVNILQLSTSLNSGGIPPVSLVSALYAKLLQCGGCKVTEDDIYISIMSGNDGSNALIGATIAALNKFFPSLDTGDDSPKD